MKLALAITVCIGLYLCAVSAVETQKSDGDNDEAESPILYGKLLLAEYNGDQTMDLCKKPKGNGVRRSGQHKAQSPQTSEDKLDANQYSISFESSQYGKIIVKYEKDANIDKFQFGRANYCNDHVFATVIPSSENLNVRKIADYACRILIDRHEPAKAHIYAAGFDAHRNIHLGKEAIQWQDNDEMDGFTEESLFIKHPKGQFVSDNTENPGTTPWRECSVGGHIFHLPQSDQQKGKKIDGETNMLQDGTLIDMSRCMLLWRSAEGLKKSPSKSHLEKLLNEIIQRKPRCPISIDDTLVIPREEPSNDINQAYVYLKCGHVQGNRIWVGDEKTGEPKCSKCGKKSAVAPLCLGYEPAFYLDFGPLTHAFTACGHMATEKTVKYWASVELRKNTQKNFLDVGAKCPFCGLWLIGSPGYIKLEFDYAESDDC